MEAIFYCTKCGNAIRVGSKFCTYCGADMRDTINNFNSSQPQLYPDAGTSYTATAAARSRTDHSLIKKVLIIVAIVIGVLFLFFSSGNGKVTAGSAARTVCKAIYKSDEKAFVSMVPESVLDRYSQRYDVSRSKIKSATEEVLKDWTKDGHYGKVVSSEMVEIIEPYAYRNEFSFMDITNFLDIDDITDMRSYKVHMDTGWVYNDTVYKYKGDWYSVYATRLVHSAAKDAWRY